jgi:hypothetical protein
MSRGKFDGVPTGELFSVDDGMRDHKQRRRSAKSQAQGNCPRCLRPKVGLVLVGEHLVWRQHDKRTCSGAPVECQASGVSACVAPEAEPFVNPERVRCPHDRR